MVLMMTMQCCCRSVNLSLRGFEIGCETHVILWLDKARPLFVRTRTSTMSLVVLHSIVSRSHPTRPSQSRASQAIQAAAVGGLVGSIRTLVVIPL